MRPDKQKLQATQESGRKDQQKDLEHDGQLHAASKQGHKREEAGQGRVKRRDGSSDEMGSPRTSG